MKSKQKFALFMLPLLTRGAGAEKYFINLAKNFSEFNTQTDVVTMNKKFFMRFVRLLKIYYNFDFSIKIKLPMRETPESVKKALGKAKWKTSSFTNLKHTLNKYDIIYSKNELVDLFLLKLIGYRKLPPIIVGVHTPIYYPVAKTLFEKLHNTLYLSPLYKWLLDGVKLIHVVNSDDKALLKTLTNTPIQLIFYPFDIQKKNLKKRQKDRSFNILFVGRISEQKGIDILIKVIENLSKQKVFLNMQFWIAGTGVSLLEQPIQKFDKKFSNVKYLGHVPHTEITKLYEWCDISIIPSRYETVNYIALETGSHEKIAVASDIPGPRDVIVHKKTGFLLKPEPDNFVKIILNLFKMKKQNPKHFSQIGKNARKYINKKFNPEQVYLDLGTMFQKIKNENTTD